MNHIFISDLHLDPERSDLTDAFLRFLQTHCHDIDGLYILGDFFEVWLGDDDQSPFSRQIVNSLAALTCKVTLMHGNRDFLLGQQFCDAAHAELTEDPTIVTLGEQQILLMHGDSLCTRDEAYMAARATLRSPAFQADFLTKSLEERAIFARQIRGESKAHTRESAADIMDVTPGEVVRVMEEAGVQIMIHGHTHRPAEHAVPLSRGPGIRYVLGDWHTSMQYLSVTDQGFALKRYDF